MAAVSVLGTPTFNTTSGTHTVTATPAVNDLIVIVVANTGSTTSVAPTDNNSSGTYTLINSAVKATSADTMRIYIRDTLIGSATSTIFTQAPGTTTGGGLVVLKVTGMTKTGAAAAVQSIVQNNQAAALTPNPQFTNTPDSTNPVIGAIFNAQSPAGLTPRTGYTELFDNGYGTPATGLEVMSRDSGETTAGITWGSTSGSAFCSVIVELDSSPSVTQASYRFYEDGTESGSTATAAQDTSISRDLTSGNSNLALRLRLQNAGPTAAFATDDYQLQYSWNGGGYGDVGTGKAIDSYDISNQNTSTGLGSSIQGVYQSFTGDGSTLGSIQLNIAKNGASPGANNVVVRIYAHTGTFGTSSAATGSVLATSDAITANNLIQSSNLGVATTFTFSGANQITLTAGTKYVWVVYWPFYGGTGNVLVGVDSTSPTHAGNGGIYDGSFFTADSTKDYPFTISSTSVPVLAYNSASLTDGSATTNRLGAGTGSFVAGEISETGLVTDHQITASNYTEHLYSLTLASSALVNGDTLDFRVLRNGAAITTYSVTPRITVSPYTLVQSYVKSAAVSPGVSPTFTIPVAVNDLIVVAAGFDTGTASLVSGVTDSLGNTYTRQSSASNIDATNAISLDVWTAPVTVAGSSNVVSVAFNDTSTNINYAVQHYTGFTGTPTADQATVALNASATTTSSGATGTTAQATELVIGASVHNGAGSNYTAGTGFGNLTQNSITNRQIAMESKPVGSTGTQTATFGIAAARASITGVVTFYSAASGSVLTKTQTAVARIAINSTKTQPATARIAKNLTKTQPAISRISNIITKTQPTIARVANNVTKTQPATARIANSGVVKTQNAIARIATNRSQTQTAISRIANIRTKTQPAVSRISQTYTVTQPSIARLEKSVTKTQTATARIQVPLTKTQPSISRISQNYTKTQAAVSRVANTLTKTQTATANIVANLTPTKTQPAIARIATNRTTTQGAISRIAANLTKTQGAVARVANNRTATQPAVSRISNTKTKTQPAVSRIQQTVSKTQPAVSRISQGYTKTQTSISRISNIITATQPAISRVARNLTKTQSATARIANSGVVKTQGAIARIATNRATTQTAIARISQNYTKTQPSIARIATNSTKTQPATAKIASSVSKTQSAVSRIANIRTKTQPSVSRIATTVTKTQPAVSRVANVRTKTQTATASITQNGLNNKTQPATARIAVSRSTTQGAIARIAIRNSRTQAAVSRIAQNYTKTQPAASRISKNFTKTQSATASIYQTRTFTQSATAHIYQTVVIERTTSLTLQKAAPVSLTLKVPAAIAITAKKPQVTNLTLQKPAAINLTLKQLPPVSLTLERKQTDLIATFNIQSSIGAQL